MCGIWAIFGSDENVSKQCSACLTIAHRGPDSFRIENVNHFPNCCFGFHRLAIVDDIYGMQPMRLNCLPHLWLCYNGEIYNYKLLAKEFGFKYETECDGESILQLYNYGGIEFAAKHLDGVFAFIVLDTAAKKVFVGRDTLGVRPAFKVLTSEGFLAVSSEAKGLTDLVYSGNGTTAIDPVLPGFYEEYDLQQTGKVKLNQVVRFHDVGLKPKYQTLITIDDEKDVHGNIRKLLKAAVKKRMMGHRRIGCMLSGGLDSSLIAALVVECAKELELSYPIQTFSVGMADSPDVIAAEKVAKHLGSEHHVIEFTPEEGVAAIDELIYYLESYDITTIRASLGMYLISKYIQEKSDSVVIFSGEGADELAQGYIYFHKAPDAEAADAESLRLMKDLYMYDVLRADRCTAAHGLELRVPFLDHQFGHYFLSLPSEMRQPVDGIEKHILRTAFSGTGLIPDDILWRPKEAFSDGVSSQKKSWFLILQENADKQIPDGELEDSPSLYKHNPPRTKEAFLYRKIFEKRFKGQSKWIPYYWMPKWIEATDPSQRTLQIYKSSD
ncbi:asparagine synthetase [glutamine-hydrolyzing] [Palaemon carinicauda]|uniref:asparagine synthetase [glutamine-hydrolyzing] n=1 Tax=Palaemon carinicauda TaxID=392227 RepID=UPI0035B5E05B